jgi:hypothetical protein
MVTDQKMLRRVFIHKLNMFYVNRKQMDRHKQYYNVRSLHLENPCD